MADGQLRLQPSSNPYTVGYAISPNYFSDKSHGVQAGSGDIASGVTPYLLAKFDDNCFASVDNSPAKVKANEVYDFTRVARNLDPAYAGTPAKDFFRYSNHYIVTNAAGLSGTSADALTAQYWNTNALDDSGPNTGRTANYAGKPDATNNATARFKDGEYNIVIFASDLIHAQSDITIRTTRVVNFVRVAEAAKGGAAPPAGTPENINPSGHHDYEPQMPNPAAASTAAGFPQFMVGDVVGVRGQEFYPNQLMYAYVVPHKPGGWKEDDALNTGAVSKVVVKSDANGVVPLTQGWTAGAVGKYDVVIDYEGDGLFTWKIDALTGFEVKPKPEISNEVWLDDFRVFAGLEPKPTPVGDGLQGSGDDDAPLAGVPIILIDEANQPVAFTTTAANGSYRFSNVTPGKYRLDFEVPDIVYHTSGGWTEYTFTIRDAAGTGTPESGIDSDADPATGLTDWFTVGPGDELMSVDAGVLAVHYAAPGGSDIVAPDDPPAMKSVAPAAVTSTGGTEARAAAAPPVLLAAGTEGPPEPGTAARPRLLAAPATNPVRWHADRPAADFDLHPVRVGSA